MNNLAKITVVTVLATQLVACGTFGSGYESNKGFFDVNGNSSNVDISNAISASMDSTDQERLGHALSTTRNTQPYAWQNPVTGNNYKLLAVRTFVDDQGEPCRYYYLTGTLRGETRTMHATTCRVAGTWQMNSL